MTIEATQPTQTDEPDMRGADTFTQSLFTMRHLDDFVPTDHTLWVIRVMVNKALANMDGLFGQMYAAKTSKAGVPALHPRNCCTACSFRCSTACARSATSWG